jgi:hypothetical protein
MEMRFALMVVLSLPLWFALISGHPSSLLLSSLVVAGQGIMVGSLLWSLIAARRRHQRASMLVNHIQIAPAEGAAAATEEEGANDSA